MKTVFSSAAATLALFAVGTSPVAADHHDEPAMFTPVEMHVCTFRNGKGMKDLMNITKRFNRWVEEANVGYTYWILTPRYRASEEEFDFGWMGTWDDGAHMGSVSDRWRASDDGINDMINASMECQSSLATAVRIDMPWEEWPKESVTWFARCYLQNKATVFDAVDAHNESTAGLRERGASVAASWAFMPGLGFGDADFDYYHVQGWQTYEDLGHSYDAYYNLGGWRVQSHALQGVVECKSPNLYETQLMYSTQ